MDGWGRVSGAVIDRRAELGLTQKELAAKAGVAERTVQNLEGGRQPQPLIRGKIEKALGWPAGEMKRIADGDGEFRHDILADRWGTEDAARVRRVLAAHGEAGAAVLRELRREFSSDAAEAQSGK